MDAGPLLWTLAGVVGALAGLVPGLHPNVAAALVLAASAASPRWATLLLALAAGHLFGALVASAFHGSADPDAGTVEVGGREAAELAARGAFLGVVMALPLAVLARFVLGAPLGIYELAHAHRGVLLLALVLVAAALERPRPWAPLKALVVVGATGLVGLVAFRLGASGPFGVAASPLLPLFAGLFAVPGLLSARKAPKKVPLVPAAPLARSLWGGAAKGALAGSLLGVLPGVTAGHASALARAVRAPRDVDESRVLAAATAGAGLVFAATVALALGPARSGSLAAAVLLEPAASWRAWLPSPEAVRWIEATLLGAGAGCLVALAAAPRVARAWRRLPRAKVVTVAAFVLVAIVAALNGAVGLLVLAVASCAGHLAPALGVSRVHAMGVVLVPVMLQAF